MKSKFKKFLSIGIVAASLLTFSQSAFAQINDADGYGNTNIDYTRDTNNSYLKAQRLQLVDSAVGVINYNGDTDYYYVDTPDYVGGWTYTFQAISQTDDERISVHITKNDAWTYVRTNDILPTNDVKYVEKQFTLEPNTRYFFRVKQFNEDGWSTAYPTSRYIVGGYFR